MCTSHRTILRNALALFLNVTIGFDNNNIVKYDVSKNLLSSKGND